MVTQRFDAELAKAGVKATQFTILTAAKLAGAVTVTELAELVVLEQSSLSRNLAVMVRQGWLELHPPTGAGADRRVRVVRLTAKGLRTLTRAWPHWLAAQAAIERHFSSQGLQHGLGFLDQMTSSVRGRGRGR